MGSKMGEDLLLDAGALLCVRLRTAWDDGRVEPASWFKKELPVFALRGVAEASRIDWSR